MTHVDHSASYRYVQWLWRWRIVMILVIALVVAGSGAGMSRLELASSYEIYFDEGNPQLEALRSLHNTFSRNDNLLFAVAPASSDVFTPRILMLMGRLTSRGWQLSYASRVSSVTNFQHIESSQDEIRIQDLLVAPKIVSAEKAQEIRDIALGESQLVGKLVSANGAVAGVNVRLELDPADREGLAMVVREARELVAQFEREYPDVRLYLTGNAVLNASFPEASVHDLTHLTPLMYLVMTVAIGLLLRSFRSALIVMSSVVLSGVVAMGSAGWAGLPVSSASVVAPTIVTTVVIAYAVHILTAFLRLRADGQAPMDSIAVALAQNIRAVCVAALSTAAGFLSLNFSDAPPFRDLGNITSIGVVAAFGLCVVLLPLLLLIFTPSGRWGPLIRLDKFALWIVRYRGQCLLAVCLVAVVATVVTPRLELNDSFVEYFDQSIKFRSDTDFVMEHLTGIYEMEFVVRSGRSDGVYDPVYIDAMERFETWLKEQPEVMNVFTVAQLVQRLHTHLRTDSSALPAEREQIAQYLLLYELSVPYGLDLNDRIDVDRESSRVSVTLQNLDNASLRVFEERTRQWLASHVPKVMQAQAVGAAIMFTYIAQRNIQAMLAGAALAVVVIAALLAAFFREGRLGIISLLPNALPALIAIAIWTLTVGEMGVALAIVVTMTLGIVVDDTVHFVSSFLHGRRVLSMSAEAAVVHAFSVTGSALVSTSVVLVLGFSVLTLSAFEVNHAMGQLTALVIVCALIADFLMLPGLLIAAARRGWV